LFFSANDDVVNFLDETFVDEAMYWQTDDTEASDYTLASMCEDAVSHHKKRQKRT